MLHHEVRLHTKLGALLDAERLRLECFQAPGGSQVDGDVGAAFNFQGEGFDYTASLVLGVDGDRRARGYAEGSFPAVERFVILI